MLIGYNSPGAGAITAAPFDTQFRFTGTTTFADFFNLFNRVNLDKPNATNININSATFGQATTAGAGRIIQFAGRFEF